MATGTLNAVTLDGTTFKAAADVEAELKLMPFENADVPNSGGSVKQQTKVTPRIEGVVLVVDQLEDERLLALHGQEDISMSVEEADGTVHSTVGWINYEGKSTAQNRGTLTLFSSVAGPNPWSRFIG